MNYHPEEISLILCYRFPKDVNHIFNGSSFFSCPTGIKELSHSFPFPSSFLQEGFLFQICLHPV